MNNTPTVQCFLNVQRVGKTLAAWRKLDSVFSSLGFRGRNDVMEAIFHQESTCKAVCQCFRESMCNGRCLSE